MAFYGAKHGSITTPEKIFENSGYDDSEGFENYQETAKIIEELNTFPDEIDWKFLMPTKYGNQTPSELYRGQWASESYGGSVFNPIVNKNSSIVNEHIDEVFEDSDIVITNYLLDDLYYLENCIGVKHEQECILPHYFNLSNLFVEEKEDHAVFADVHILITPELTQHEKFILYKIAGFDSGDFDSEISMNEVLESGYGWYGNQYFRFEDVKHLLTGYGRIMIYEVYTTDTEHPHEHVEADDVFLHFNPAKDPQQNLLTILQEGHFHEGLVEGYARVMTQDHKCDLGYFRQGEAWGKHQFYQYEETTYWGQQQDYRQSLKMVKQGIFNNYNPVMAQMYGIPLLGYQIISFQTNINPSTMEEMP